METMGRPCNGRWPGCVRCDRLSLFLVRFPTHFDHPQMNINMNMKPGN